MSKRGLVDPVVAGGLTVAGLAEALLGLTVDAGPPWVAVTVPLVTLPVAFRASRTVPAAIVLLAGMLVQAATGSDLAGGFAEPVALVLVVFAVGSRLALRTSAVLLGLTFAAVSAAIVMAGGVRTGNLVFASMLVLAPWLAGRAVRLADERSALLAEHSALLERDSALLAERAAAAERGRIARELHDVVSHHLSAIVVQAAAERRDLAADARAGAVLAGIEERGRVTLDELRRLLGVLRAGDAEPLALAPQPGLADLPSLVEALRHDGVCVRIATDGTPRRPGVGVELAAYRVVQEALTNVRKHSRADTVDVLLRWGRDELGIDVRDGGVGPRRPPGLRGAGVGLLGLRERVEAYGGRVLAAGPRGAGFEVSVALPLGGAQ